MSYPSGAASTDSTEANPLRIFFINNGLPWTTSIEKPLSEQGFQNVELLKLLKDDEWDALFVNGKIAQKNIGISSLQRSASRLFEGIEMCDTDSSEIT